MGKSLLYVVIILFSSLILAVGWVDLSLGSKRIELGPLGLPVSYSCPEELASVHGADLSQMDASIKAVQNVKKHVQSVDIIVIENKSKQAGFLVAVVMNSGNRVQTRMRDAAWNRLDTAMAKTIHRCVDEFMTYDRTREDHISNVMLTI